MIRIVQRKLENGIYLTSNKKSIDIINTLNKTNVKIDRENRFYQAQLLIFKFSAL